MQELDELIRKAEAMDVAGELTIDKIFHPGFYRLLEGEHANRVIVYSLSARVDGIPVLLFANGMTWIYRDKLANVRCERAYPFFNKPRHEVDVSQSSWYADNGDGPYHHEW